MRKSIKLLTALALSVLMFFTLPCVAYATEPTESSSVIAEEVETPADFVAQVQTWYDTIRFRILPLIMGLVYAGCGFRILSPIFFGENASDASRSFSSTIKIFVYSSLGFLVAILLPLILEGVIHVLKLHAWQP